MPFFADFTPQKLAALILLAAGALITYKSEKIAVALKKPQFNMFIKISGWATVVVAFVIIMTTV